LKIGDKVIIIKHPDGKTTDLFGLKGTVLDVSSDGIVDVESIPRKVGNSRVIGFDKLPESCLEVIE